MKTKKEQIKQKIIAIFVVTFMFTMMIGAVNINLATGATAGNTILQQVVSGGSLSLETLGQVNFNTFTLNGVSTNSLANLTQVNFRDSRGSGAGFNVVGSANNMQSGADNTIDKVFLRWSPGTIYALDGSSNTGVTAGAAYSGNFGDGSKTLASATSNNGMGNYVINGTAMNLLLMSSVPAGTYQNTLLLTIS